MGSLWMGDLEMYMNEAFIANAFSTLGENVLRVKMIKNKFTGQAQGYCFVDFENQEAAERVLRKFNGKPVPMTNPMKRFKLNRAAYGQTYQSTEYSLFVGDLTPEVEDISLHDFFAKRYNTCKAGKVVKDSAGNSKCYGFIRFTSEDDQQRALMEMNNVIGLGGKPIRVARAIPKRPQHSDQQQSSQPYDPYYQQYQQYQNYYAGWGGYPQQPVPAGTSQHGPPPPPPPPPDYYNYGPSGQYDNTQFNYQHNRPGAGYDDSHDATEDPNPPLDIDQMNSEFMTRSEELYEALENSRWNPLDSVTSEIPGIKT
ncbi:tRNA selenocysteine 1-associated protein 1-like [Glandiceps talaboti]